MEAKLSIEDVEVDLLIKAVYEVYGYDFAHYSKASLKRRIRDFCSKRKIRPIANIIPQIIHEKNFFASFLDEITVTVTEFFRDPTFFSLLRTEVIPILKTYPFVKIWVAGCATGEEAYSLAIILEEENFLHKSWIYATDINKQALSIAREGVYNFEKIKMSLSSYRESGGLADYYDYFILRHDLAAIKHSLKEKIVFSEHNLICDGVFSEAHLILCRNVLIYFDKILQARVLGVFDESLCQYGFFCIGAKETLRFTHIEKQYRAFDEKNNIYQKI